MKEVFTALHATGSVRVLGALFFVLAPVFAGVLAAATIRVPADVQTIQGAINAASNGDTVLVGPGTYLERINFLGKAITVISEQGPGGTIIEPHSDVGPLVTFAAGETQASRLSGFTIRNGRASFGAGIFIQLASPQIDHNVITQNEAADGAGILMTGGSAVITDNAIVDNRLAGSTLVGGAGILVHQTSGAQISRNDILRNTVTTSAGGGGLNLANGSGVTVSDNLISGNSAPFGGGIFIDASVTAAEIVQNLIVNNSAINGGGVIWNVAGSRMINNTIANNVASAPDASEVILLFQALVDNALIANNIIAAKQNPITLDCSNPLPQSIFIANDVFNLQGVPYGPGCGVQSGIRGSISLDPLFVDDTAGSFRLKLGSPAIDVGTNAISHLPAADLDGNPRIADGDSNGTAVIDMGAFEFGDSLAPVITAVTASPNTLVQANHQMVPIHIGVSASDNSGQAVTCRIVSVASNEPVQGLGDGDTAPDWLITGNFTVNLRAERSGKGSGRIYTVTVECADASGNRASSFGTVTVPRNN